MAVFFLTPPPPSVSVSVSLPPCPFLPPSPSTPLPFSFSPFLYLSISLSLSIFLNPLFVLSTLTLPRLYLQRRRACTGGDQHSRHHAGAGCGAKGAGRCRRCGWRCRRSAGAEAGQVTFVQCSCILSIQNVLSIYAYRVLMQTEDSCIHPHRVSINVEYECMLIMPMARHNQGE